MSYRYYLDEDIPPRAAEIGRALDIDVVSAASSGMIARADPDHLRAAATAGRIVVTYNRNDFLVATEAAVAMHAPHAGLIILARRLPRDAARIAHTLRRFDEEAPSRYGVPRQPYRAVYLSG